jgi:hypothetical protein
MDPPGFVGVSLSQPGAKVRRETAAKAIAAAAINEYRILRNFADINIIPYPVGPYQ